MTGSANGGPERGTGREFEEHVAGLCRRDGCISIANAGNNSDLNADLVGPYSRRAHTRRAVQALRTVPPGREWGDAEFIGMAKVEPATGIALFVTTATFTPAAVDLAVRHGVTAVHRGMPESRSAGRALQTLR